MAVTPTQIRWVDPYEKIMTTNAINEQFSTLLRTGKGIIDGLSLSLLNTTSFRVSSGLFIADKTVIKTDQVDVNLSATSFTPATENVIYIHFEYHLEVPLYQAYVEVEDSSTVDHTSIQNVILGFVVIDGSGNINSISYTGSSYNRDTDPRYYYMFLNTLFDPKYFPKVSVDANLVNLKIINVADPTDDLDLTNKRYVDSQITDMYVDELVKTDASDADSSYFTGINKGNYLAEELVVEGDFSTLDDIRVLALGNIDISNPPSIIDNVTLNNNDRIGLFSQTTPTENGIYIYHGSGNSLTRASDFDIGDHVQRKIFLVSEGAVNGGKKFVIINTSPDDVVGTSNIQISEITFSDSLTPHTDFALRKVVTGSNGTNKTYQLYKTNNKVCITSGDSKGIFGRIFEWR